MKGAHIGVLAVILCGSVSVLCLCGCSGGDGLPTGSTEHLAGTSAKMSLSGVKWHPVRVAGTNQKAPQQVLLLLSDDGRATGFAGVNCFFGRYECVGRDGLKFSKLSTTRMSGPDLRYEQTLLGQLNKVDRYELSDGELRLYGGTDEVAVFSAYHEAE